MTITAAALIDCHTHAVPFALTRLAARGSGFPHLDLSGDRACFRCGTAPARPLDSRCWDAARRIDEMGARGVALQLLSPMPMTYGYDLDAASMGDFWRVQNDGMAEMVAADPARFAALGAVPLQDPDAAIRELERVMGDLGLKGVEIGTRVGEHDLDAPELAPFWARCAALGALVFIHPESAMGRRVRGRLEPSVGYPSETGIVAAKLMAGGLFTRHPALRVLLAHAGGTLPWMLQRMDEAWAKFPDMRAEWPLRPSDQARSFHYDSLTFGALNLRFAIARLGDDRIVVGSDYPFNLSEDPPGGTLALLDELSAEKRSKILHGNAAALLGLAPPAPTTPALA